MQMKARANPNVSAAPCVPSAPPSKTHCEITCKTEKDFWDHAKTFAELLGIVLLAVYTAYTIKMYCTNKTAAGAAQDAAHTADQTLRMAYRPWVTAQSVTLLEPLTFPPQHRFNLKVVVNLKNTGTSVATDGIAMPDAEPDFTAIISKNVHRSCDTANGFRSTKARDTPWETGFVLAPGDVLAVPATMGSDDISPEQIGKGQFYILGCVIYSDQYKTWHHTQFCFQPDSPVLDPSKIVFRLCDWYGEAN